MIATLSVAPALAVAVLLFLWPPKYTATFVYERQLSESQHSVLLRRFYSQENLDKIIRRLREQGLGDYAERLDQARVRQSFDKLIRFEVSPMYPKRLQTTDPTTSAAISAFQSRLLFVKVLGDSEQQVLQAGAIMTNNVESILPLYDARNELKESIQRYQTLAAQIEDNRFALTVDIQAEQGKLQKLKGVEGAVTQTAQDNIVLQFTDVKNSSEFLPLPNQVLAIQSRIIDLQETLASDHEKYGFYLKVLDLNSRLLKRIEESLLTDCTVQQFLAFLSEQLLACQEDSVADYLKSYIRKTENLVLVNTRAGEKPVVYPVPKGTARNSILAFALFLMIALFAAVLSEHRRRRNGAGASGSPP
ncbi:MAG TPA: hypothetical protein VLI39_05000 [Sedimentisphaerales bacterium]|nr:hypothetical protein [Sedimentisphaerales bacterium]